MSCLDTSLLIICQSVTWQISLLEPGWRWQARLSPSPQLCVVTASSPARLRPSALASVYEQRTEPRAHGAVRAGSLWSSRVCSDHVSGAGSCSYLRKWAGSSEYWPFLLPRILSQDIHKAHPLTSPWSLFIHLFRDNFLITDVPIWSVFITLPCFAFHDSTYHFLTYNHSLLLSSSALMETR